MTAKEALKRIVKRANAYGWVTENIDDEIIVMNAINRLEELEQITIKGFNPNTDEYEYGQLFYSKENGYEVKNKNGDLLTNVMIQKANDDYFKMKNVLKIIKEKQVMFPIIITMFYCYEDEALKEYNRSVGKGRKLTQTEFNLLKEYLK